MSSQNAGGTNVGEELLEQVPRKREGIAVSELQLVEALLDEEGNDLGEAEHALEQSPTPQRC